MNAHYHELSRLRGVAVEETWYFPILHLGARTYSLTDSDFHGHSPAFYQLVSFRPFNCARTVVDGLMLCITAAKGTS